MFNIPGEVEWLMLAILGVLAFIAVAILLTVQHLSKRRQTQESRRRTQDLETINRRLPQILDER